MHAQVAPAFWIYQINERLYSKALDGVSPAHMNERAGGAGNSLLFVAGHLLASRHVLLALMGSDTPNPWGEFFGRGAPHLAASAYPPIDEIRVGWQKVTEELNRRLEEISEAELATVVPYEFPVDDRTVLGAIAFLAMHESFHIGQFSLIRKLLGYDTLAG